MAIEWDKVTWYSKTLAIIFFLMTFAMAFYFGAEFEKVRSTIGNLPTPTPAAPVFTTPHEAILLPNQTVKVGALILTFNSVTGDSRCPLDVQCIQAGWVDVSITLNLSGKIETRTLSSADAPVEFGKYKISISAVSPESYSTKEIFAGDYRVTFKITE